MCSWSNVDYFLGTVFTCIKHKDGNNSAHLCQSVFTEFASHWSSVHNENKVPNITPYFSGFPVDSITTIDPLDPGLQRQIKVYQSIVGCIHWLATCTCPDIAPDIAFLALYRNSSHPQHYKGRSPCSQIPIDHEWIRNLVSLTIFVYNPGIQPLSPSSW